MTGSFMDELAKAQQNFYGSRHVKASDLKTSRKKKKGVSSMPCGKTKLYKKLQKKYGKKKGKEVFYAMKNLRKVA